MEIKDFDGSKQKIAGQNVEEAKIFEGDVEIRFHEDYVVLGETLKASSIRATYGLKVHGNLEANEIAIGRDLFVAGDIHAKKLNCKKLVCLGKIDVDSLVAGCTTIADSIKSNEITVEEGNLLVRNSISFDKRLKTAGFVAADLMAVGEQIDTKSIVAVTYCTPPSQEIKQYGDILIVLNNEKIPGQPRPIIAPPISKNFTLAEIKKLFIKEVSLSFEKWSDLEEDKFLNKVTDLVKDLPSLHVSQRIMKRIMDFSYLNKLSNLRDYLYLIYAKNILPPGIANYDTIKWPIADLLRTVDVQKLFFKADNVVELAVSLYIVENFHENFSKNISREQCLDKIFQSVGLLYSTVKHRLGGKKE